MQGVPCRLEAIVELAKKHNLLVIEDCCQCVGGQYKGKYAGTWGQAGAWSLKLLQGNLLRRRRSRLYRRPTMSMNGAAFAAEPGLPMWMSDSEWQNKTVLATVLPNQRNIRRDCPVYNSQSWKAFLAHTRRLKKAFGRRTRRDPRKATSDNMSMIRVASAVSVLRLS